MTRTTTGVRPGRSASGNAKAAACDGNAFGSGLASSSASAGASYAMTGTPVGARTAR